MVFPDTLAARACQHGFSNGLRRADVVTAASVPSWPMVMRK